VVGVGLFVSLLLVLRSKRVQTRVHAAGEVFARRFEAGIFVGLCAGVLLVILGLVVGFG
jgi:hypothetical protein